MSAITIDAAISQLVIPGLLILDITKLPQQVTSDQPLLFPDPSKWGGGSASTPGNYDNVIAGKVNSELTLGYVFAFAPAGSGRGIYEVYGPMSAMARLIEATIIKKVDVVSVSIRRIVTSPFGTVTDPAGKSFYGAFITITAQEFYVP